MNLNRGRLVPLFLAGLLLAQALPVFSQAGKTVSGGGGNAPFLIPQTVFVGDRGRLVFPLGSAFSGVENRVIQGIENLPQAEDVVISRVELTRRGNASQLIIDFQAYVPGLVKLPPIEIASYTFPDLEITITSILGSSDQRNLVLSGPADPLSAPGTAVMIYGAILFLILGLLALTLGRFWGRTRFLTLRERFRRRQIIRAMGKSLKRLRNSLIKEKGGLSAGGKLIVDSDGGREKTVLTELSREFRTYLGLLTGANCRAMVPREFLSLPSLGGGKYLEGDFISSLFRSCDTLRFNGGAVEREAALGLLDDFKKLTDTLDAAERAKTASRARSTAAPGNAEPRKETAGGIL